MKQPCEYLHSGVATNEGMLVWTCSLKPAADMGHERVRQNSSHAADTDQLQQMGCHLSKDPSQRNCGGSKLYFDVPEGGLAIITSLAGDVGAH